MLISAGPAVKVSSNISGRISDLMPPDIAIVYKISEAGTLTWTKGAATNTLNNLEQGEMYYAFALADVDVLAFEDPTDPVKAFERRFILKTSSDDNDFGDFPTIAIENNTTSLIKFFLAGRDDDSYNGCREMTAVLSCSDSGLVIFENTGEDFTFGDSDLALAATTNKIIPKAKNTTVSYVGATKWALKIEMTVIKYKILL